MLSQFKSHIHAQFSPLLHALRTLSSEPPRQYFEFERTTCSVPVGIYRDHLIVRYEKEHDVLGRMRQLCITEICLVKEMDSGTLAGHEYLVACVTPPDGPAQYLSFEHHCHGDITNRVSKFDSPLPSTVTTRTQPRLPSPRCPLSSQSSLDSSYKDSVSNVAIKVLDSPTRKSRDRQLLKLTLTSGNPLYLYQLVVLAITVHNSEMCHRILSDNCHWFSRLMLNILKGKFSQMSTSIVKPSAKIKLGPILRKSESEQSAGISLYKPAPEEDVKLVIEDLNKGIQDFEDNVTEWQKLKEDLAATEQKRKDLEERMQKLLWERMRESSVKL